MLNAGIIERCEVSTKWNTKAFPVPKQDGTSCRVVGIGVSQQYFEKAVASYRVMQPATQACACRQQGVCRDRRHKWVSSATSL